MASAFLYMRSPVGDIGRGQHNFVIYRDEADARAATAPPAGAPAKDVAQSSRYRVTSRGPAESEMYADVAAQLLRIAAPYDASARAALEGGPVYGVPFTLPEFEQDDERPAAVAALGQIQRLIGSVDPTLYDYTTVITADLGDAPEVDDEALQANAELEQLLAQMDAEAAEADAGAGGSVFSRYYLNGTADDEEVRPVLRIPWEGFTPGPPTRCLIDGIAEKYSAAHIAAANRRISQKTVNDWFAKTGPTLEALKGFAQEYRIPLRVYDISGAEILTMRVTVPAKSGSRKGLGVLAYNGHAYFRDGPIADDLRLIAKADHDIPVFRDTRQLRPEDESAMESSILLRFLEWAPANKSWKAERHLGARSLSYVHRRARADEYPGAQGWDMTKAFHTAVKKDFRGVGIPVAQKIPVFTAVDDWVVAGTHPFPSAHLWPLTYFLVKYDVAVGWARQGSAAGYLAGRVNNLLTGPEFEYLVAAKRLSPNDISGWKTATCSVPAGRYEHFTRHAALPDRTKIKHATVLLKEQEGRPRTLPGEKAQAALDKGTITLDDVEGWSAEGRSFGAFLDELDGDQDQPPGVQDPQHELPQQELGGLTRSQFAMYHGLFGRTVTQAHRLDVTADALDAELLSVAHSRVSRNVWAAGSQVAAVELSQSRDLLMNARTTYDYIVASTNLVMMRVVDEIEATQPDAVLLKLQTDAIVYDRPVTLPAWAAPLFHPETPSFGHGVKRIAVHDPQHLRDQIAAEIEEVATKIVGYVGAPGTGKTHAVKTTHEYDEAMAFSNITARNLDGVTAGGVEVRGRTLDEGLRLQSPADLSAVCGRARGRTWWIDEISTIRASVWSVIVEVASRGLGRLILTGDPNQIPPIDERFRADSTLIRAILARATVLVKDYRNDNGLVSVRDRVLALSACNSSGQNAAAFVRTLHADYPCTNPDERAEAVAAANVHITHTRATADAINRKIAKARGLVFERAGEGVGAAHTISAGVRVRCCTNFKDIGICNGDVFEVVEPVAPGHTMARLRPISFSLGSETPDGAAAAAPVAVSTRLLHAFTMGWAFTTHSTIGVTVRGQHLCIYEAAQMISVDPAILYTAVTRACTIESVTISATAV